MQQKLSAYHLSVLASVALIDPSAPDLVGQAKFAGNLIGTTDVPKDHVDEFVTAIKGQIHRIRSSATTGRQAANYLNDGLEQFREKVRASANGDATVKQATGADTQRGKASRTGADARI